MLKGSALSSAILVVPIMLDLPTFVARLIQMDCVRIAVITRRGRGDGVMGSVGAWEHGRTWEHKLMVGIGHNGGDR